MQELTMMNPSAADRPIGVANRTQAMDGGSGQADQTVTVMATAGVTVLTGLGWVLSYTALRQLALSAGVAAWAATLWPLCVDLFVFVATLAAIADRRRGRSTAYAWSLAVAYSAATVAGNVLAAGPDHVAQAVHATPAVTMVLAWHLLSRFFDGHGATREAVAGPEHARPKLRRERDDRGVNAAAERPGRRLRRRPEQREVATWIAELERSGRRATGAAVATRFGVSGRTGRRMLADMGGRSGAPQLATRPT
jgi:hypothetical protein